MAVFSNLEGTMKRSFILGKNGAKLSTDGVELRVTNYQDDQRLPISAANPVDDTHLVTLGYLKANTGTGGNHLSGGGVPSDALGVDGDVYYQVDSTKIIAIFFKDHGIWKPFFGGTGPTDSAYTTSVLLTPADFVADGAGFKATVPESVHMRGVDFILQLQGDTGDLMGATSVVDGFGLVEVQTTVKPVGNINLIFVGRTTMTVPYTKKINVSSWTNITPNEVQLVIPASEHNQVPGSIFVAVYENTVAGPTSLAPYAITMVGTNIAANGDVTLSTITGFSGKVVISGK